MKDSTAPQWHLILCLFASQLLSGLGCSRQETWVPPAPPKQELHAIPSPDYASWVGYPVGTKLVRYKEVANDEGVVKVTSTLVLKEKSDERLVVESQISVVRPDITTDNPPQVFEFPKEFMVPLDMPEDAYDLPAPNAKLVGTEKITVAGREYDAEVFAWEGTLEMGKVDMKLWRHREFPGRQIRLETDYRGSNHQTAKEETRSLEIPTVEQ